MLLQVFKLVGFGNLSYLSLEDQASLCLIEKYIKFRQGEVWHAIKEEFDDAGFRPTAPDRERLASGARQDRLSGCGIAMGSRLWACQNSKHGGP